MTDLYTIDRTDWPSLERVWAHCQYAGIDMYKARVGSYTSWMVELPCSSPKTTRFLLEYSAWVSRIGPR